MEIYSNTKNRVFKKGMPDILFNKDELTLFDFSTEEALVAATEETLIIALCNDFKRALELEKLEELISEIFKIENQINLIKEKGSKVPDLSIFYQNLSPVLLRSLWEVLNDDPQQKSEGENSGSILESWKEAIRIALEEEFYLWQEKIISWGL